jgi:hypothetical protein
MGSPSSLQLVFTREITMSTKPNPMLMLLTFTSVIVPLLLLIFLSQIREYLIDPVAKFALGIVIGTLLTISSAMTKELVKAIKQRKLLITIDPNILSRPVSLIATVFVLAIGVFMWVLTREGTTGTFFGLGALVGAFLAENGIITFDEMKRCSG